MEQQSYSLPAGTTLQNGKYRIIKVLGQGGFGITYLAEQTGLAMKVAIKEFFLKGSCQRESTTARVNVPITDNRELVDKCVKKFNSEARKIASFNNDHIVSIIDIFAENGTSYFVMKYLGSGSLARRLKDGPVAEPEALSIIRQIADALKTIHGHGLLHLDVKPANILFDESGRAVLIDFGISKYVDSEQDTTTTSSLVGFSKGFAPVEQINAVASSLMPAADIYALGATLYNLVTGSIPPDATIVNEQGLPEFPYGISEATKNAITCAMQPKRRDRPQDVSSFLDLLPEETAPAEEGTVISVPVPVPAAKNPNIMLIASVAMMALALVIAGVSFFSRPKQARPDTERISSLEQQVATGEKTITDLRDQVSSLKSQNSSLSSKNANLQKQVDNFDKDKSSLSKTNSSLQSEITSLKKQVNQYKADAEKWRRYINTQQ